MITLYSLGCPKCNVLKNKLKEKNISFVECTDTSVMEKKKIANLPWLEVNNRMMDFKEAVDWIGKQ